MARKVIDNTVKERITSIWVRASEFKATTAWKTEQDEHFNVINKTEDGITCTFTVELARGEGSVGLRDLQTLADCFGSDEVEISVDSIFGGQWYAEATATLLFSITHCTRGFH